MKPFRLSVVVAALMGLAVVVVGVWLAYPFLSHHLRPAEPRLEVVVALPEHAPAAPLFVAQANGFFERHGVRPIFKRFPTGARALPAMFAGEADLATAADVPIAAAGLVRSDFRILASIARADSEVRIVARRDRGIVAPADLAGKRIGTQKLSAVHFFLDMFLARHRVVDAKPVFLKAEELVDALSRGAIDAFSMREPYVGQAEAALGANALLFEARNLYMRGEYLVARAEFLATNRPVVERFLRALIDAEGFIREHPLESQAIVARELKAELGGIGAIWSDMEVEISLSQATLRQLESEGEWASRYVEGGRPSALPNYLSVIDSEILEQIDSKRVSLVH
jgi:ABC-type nitrate/sulfonate/bicarbonate transport system substrate-binding protein